MPTLDDALGLAQAGIKIIPVHSIRNGVCSCGGNCNPKNYGKHPRTEKGVYAASSDPEQITEWWTRWPDANIGIALGDLNDGLYAQDIDNVEVANKLLTMFESDEAPTGFVVATTGRHGGGCHIYMRSTASQRTINLATTDGEYLGELRGTGSYTIAPPSMHASGRQYMYHIGDLAMGGIAQVGDPRATVLGLLRMVDVSVAPPKPRSRINYDDIPPIEEHELPFDISGSMPLTQLLSGSFPTGDRSSTLWKLGLELFIHAERLGQPITRETVAGIIKWADARIWQKYAGRKNADYMYWQKTLDAENEYVARKNGKTVRGSRADDEEFYSYLENRGLYYNKGKNSTKLANFRPEIIEQQIVTKSDGKQESTYVVRCELPDEETVITISSKDYRSEHMFRAALANQLAFGQYRIEPDGWWRTWLAAGELPNSNWPQTYHYALTGWVETDHGWGFVLPGADGMITAEGIDTSVIMHQEFLAKSPPKYLLYGINVRPWETQDEHAAALAAFTDVLDMLPAKMLVPMLDLIFGAPLCSLGLDRTPPLVHIYGKTGQLKTSCTLALMSILGQFTGRDAPESWSSTVASLQHGLHILRDLPLLIDDYKTSHMKATDAGRLVQNYADGTTRSRMAAHDQERLSSLLPQGLLISTGEERWEQEQSVQARVFSLPFDQLEVGGPAFKERSQKVRRVQQHGVEGALGLIGGTYLKFLAHHGIQKLIEEIELMRTQEREGHDLDDMQLHARVRETVISLRVVEKIVRGFIHREFPQLEDKWQELRKENWIAQADWLRSESREAESLGPLQQVLDGLRDGITSGELRLNRRRSTNFMGEIIAKVVGYYDDDGIYLTKNLTWKWIEEGHAKRRADLLFSWNKVCQEAKDLRVGSSTQLKEVGSIKALFINHEFAKVKPEDFDRVESSETF